jgi:hypothetical protein
VPSSDSVFRSVVSVSAGILPSADVHIGIFAKIIDGQTRTFPIQAWHEGCDVEIGKNLQEIDMPRGDKSSYSNKQKRQAEHIEEGYKKRGLSSKTAASRAWATVNKETGGGKKKKAAKKSSGRKSAAKKGGRKKTAGRKSAAKKSSRSRK